MQIFREMRCYFGIFSRLIDNISKTSSDIVKIAKKPSGIELGYVLKVTGLLYLFRSRR